jgi:hypothetical protein
VVVLCNNTFTCESYKAFVVGGYEFGGMIMTGEKPKSPGDKPDQMPLYLPQITHSLA